MRLIIINIRFVAVPDRNEEGENEKNKAHEKNAKWFVFVYKFSVIVGFISLSLLFIVPPLIGCLQLMPEDRAYSLFCFMLIPFFLFGFIVFLFPFVVEDPDGIAAIITKAEKYKTNVSSYEQFLSMAQESLGGDGFARVQEQAFAEYQMTLKKVFTQQ